MMCRLWTIPLLVIALLLITADVSASFGAKTKTIDELIEQLQDDKPDLRRKAADELGSHGYLAASAVPELIRTLDDDDYMVASAAVKALGKIGPEPGVVDALMLCITDEDKDFLKDSAIRALGNIGEEAACVIPLLIEMLGEKYPHNVDSILEALAQMGPAAEDALPLIVRYAADKYQRKAEKVHQILLNIGSEKSISFLLDLAETGDTEARKGAFAALGAFGEDASDAIPVLVKAIREDNLQVASEAVTAIVRITTRQDIIELMIDVLINEDVILRQAVVKAFGEIESNPDVMDALVYTIMNDTSTIASSALGAINKVGKCPVECLPVLLALLEDGNYQAIMAAGKMGADAAEAVPILMNTIGEGINNYIIITALKEIGMEAQEGIDGLLELLESDKDSVRSSAIEALKEIGPREEIISVFADLAINDPDPQIRGKVVRILGGFAPGSLEVLPVLLQAMDDDDGSIRSDARRGVAKFTDESSDEQSGLHRLIPIMESMLLGDDADARFHAAASLAKSGAEGRRILFEALKNEDDNIRHITAIAIAYAGIDHGNVLRHLLDALTSQDFVIFDSATRAIREMGGEAKRAVPRLIELLDECDGKTWYIVSTLVSIGPEPGVVDALLRLLDKEDL